jgi:hypothetical protein
MTLKPESNGFNGLGVVEDIDENFVYISTLNSWIDALKYDGQDWKRKNTIKLNINNTIKVNKENLDNLSYDSQDKYNIYIHLLKKYLENK